MRTPSAYQPRILQGVYRDTLSWSGLGASDAFSAYPEGMWLSSVLLPSGEQLAHQGFLPRSPLVLARALLKYPTLAPDRDRTVLRRSEPSSRTLLTGEQPDHWDLLQPQDRMSRHRGAKPGRRYGLSGPISLLSPG